MTRKIAAALIMTASLAALTMTAAYAVPALEDGDLDLLARIAKLEGGQRSDESQQAVIRVVLNRLEDRRWGSTISEVIYAPGQFSTAQRIDSVEAGEMEYRNVLEVLIAEEPCLPAYVLYFRADYDHDWRNYKHYTVIGGNWYGYMGRDKKDLEENRNYEDS